MRPALLAAALALTALPAVAQTPPGLPSTPPGKPDPALARAGSYTVESSHTQVSFSLDHMGFTPFMGTFGDATGSLSFDPKNLAATKLSISVPIASVQTTSAALTTKLKGAEFFDAAKYPTATFVSTGVTRTGPTTARVTGTLTLHGVSKPVTFDAKFYGAGTDFMSKKPAIGFTGTGRIMRSAFGMGFGVPLVGDEVTLSFAAAFNQ